MVGRVDERCHFTWHCVARMTSEELELPVAALPGVGYMHVIDIDTQLILDNAD